MANFQFIDDSKSLTIIVNNQEYTAAKNLIELIVKDSSVNEVLEIRSNSSRPTNFIIDLTKDTVFGIGAGSNTASELRDALKAVFFLTDGGGGGGGNVIDGDVYLNNLFEVEKDAQGNIIKTISIFDFQVPPESIEVGNAIKISDLGQSLSYSTKFDGKQYLLMGYEIGSTGSQRPFVKELQAPTSFEVQSLFDEQQTFTTSQSFGIISLQDVIGKTYNLKASTTSETFRIRLIRGGTNGGENTVIVDETIPGTQTNINGFDFDLSPITDFTINTDYLLILSVEDGDTFDVLGSSAVTGSFLPYIKRQYGWVYSKKDVAYLEDVQNAIDSVSVSTDATLTGDGTASNPLSVVGGTSGNIEIVGFWDADTNTPDLSSLTLTQGQAYQVSVGGTSSLNGYTEWNEFDLALWIDTVPGNWFRVVSTEKVLSVNGRKGDVVIDKTDVGLGNVDNTSDQDKPLSDATISALTDKVNVGGNITELNNDAGFIDSVLVDGVTVLGDGVNTPLSSVGGGSGQESTLLKTNIQDNIRVGTPNETMNPLNCFGSLKFSNGQGWSNSISGITVPNDGVYQISLRVGFISTGQRATPVVGLSVNGSLTGDESNYAYIRNSSSLNESACVLTTNLELTAGDIVGLQARKSGTVAAAINTYSVGSFFNIEQISGPKQTVGVSSLNDLTDVDLTTSPSVNQILKFNGFNFIPANESGGGGGGGNAEILDQSVNITQTSWNGNTNYVYANISVPDVKANELCIIYPDASVWQTIQSNGSTWQGFAYSLTDGFVNAVCRVTSFIGLPPNLQFHIKVIKDISDQFVGDEGDSGALEVDIDIDVYDENITVDALHSGKHFNILSPINYSVVLPALDDVDVLDVFKFKNLNDSTLKGTFVPVYGEKIENNETFELFGRGTLSIRKKYNNDGAFWSIVEISNLFDHVGQGKSKEIAFNDQSGPIEIVHGRGYRPIIKVYTADGIGGYSEADVDIDHNPNLNSFIVNLEGTNSGFIRYV